MIYSTITRTSILVMLLIGSSMAYADICPPTAGQAPPADWTPMGNTTAAPQPFQGALYGMFNRTALSCRYNNGADPLGGYVLTSNFSVQKPQPNDPRWQVISGFLTCVSSNPENCEFTPTA